MIWKSQSPILPPPHVVKFYAVKSKKNTFLTLVSSPLFNTLKMCFKKPSTTDMWCSLDTTVNLTEHLLAWQAITSEQICTSFRKALYSPAYFVHHESNFRLLAAERQKSYICNTITRCSNRDGLGGHRNMTNVWALAGESWYFPHFTARISAWHNLKREGTEGDVKVHIWVSWEVESCKIKPA